jgi:hypothetical protein
LRGYLLEAVSQTSAVFMQKEGFRKKAFVAMKKAFIFLVLPERSQNISR